jgi:hypothetical protein
METIVERDTLEKITKHYIGGEFVESHGHEVMDIIKPTNGQVMGRVTLGDQEDTRRAIAAAKTAFSSFGRSTKEERAASIPSLKRIARHPGEAQHHHGVHQPSHRHSRQRPGAGHDISPAIRAVRVLRIPPKLLRRQHRQSRGTGEAAEGQQRGSPRRRSGLPCKISGSPPPDA